MSSPTEEIREQHQNRVSGFMRYFHLLMGVLYMVFGVVFYLMPVIPDMDTWARIAISLLLLVYGSFRLWRAWKA